MFQGPAFMPCYWHLVSLGWPADRASDRDAEGMTHHPSVAPRWKAEYETSAIHITYLL